MLFRSLSLSILALAGLLFGSPIAATGFTYADVTGVRQPLRPGHFSFDAGGAYVVGNANARFNADGSLAFLTPYVAPSGDTLIARTQDGGFVQGPIPFFGTPQTLPCMLIKSNADGRMAWTESISQDGFCDALIVDAAGTIWVFTLPFGGGPGSLFRMLADGSELRQISLNLGAKQIVTDANHNSIYAVGFVGDPVSGSSIVKFNSDGSIAWQRSDSSDAVTLNVAGIDAAGNIYAAGLYSDGSEDNLAVISASPSGTARWSKKFSDIAGVTYQMGIAVAADGTSHVLTPKADGDFPNLAKIGADGTILWQRSLPSRQSVTFSLSTPQLHAGVVVAPNGDVLALADSSADDYLSPITKLVRFDAAGNTLATNTIAGMPNASFVGVTQLGVLADSSALLTTYSSFSSTGSDGVTAIGSGASSGAFVHLDRNGQSLPGPLAAASVPSNGQVADSFLASDGTSYLLTQYPYDQVNDLQNGIVQAAKHKYALSRISPDGLLVWKTQFEGFWYSARLFANSDRLCIGGSFGPFEIFIPLSEIPAASQPDTRIECHSAATGAQLFSQKLKPYRGVYTEGVMLNVHSDGSVSAASDPSSSSLSIFSLDATGQLLYATDVAIAGDLRAMASDGSVLIVSNPATIVRVTADANIAYSKTLDGANAILEARYADDGGALIVTQSSDGSFTVTSLSKTGAVTWSTPIASGTDIRSIGIDANGVGRIAVAVTSSLATRVLLLDPVTGAIQQQASSRFTSALNTIVFDPSTNNVVQVEFDDHKIGFVVVDGTSQSASDPRYLKCGNFDCAEQTPQNVGVDANGVLRMVFTPPVNTFGPQVPQIVGIGSVSHIPASISPAQSAVSGVWYAPYETGQGVIVDYIAGANTLFIPWFTYTQTGGNDPAQLIWYSFQGSVSAGAREVDLTIATAQGGAFNSGKVSGSLVGAGRITFADCENATLSYVFDGDVNGGASGTMSIVRLGPMLAACNTQTGTPLAPPFNGFDSNQSGSWYNPDTSGQGVEFTIAPASASSKGFLFGAWFTFDPPGGADDAAKQHWFSLQSDLSTGANGKIDVPIFGVIGGSLDGAPTSNAARVGVATVTFIGCDEATVQYTFDDSALAHAYRNLSGSMHLTKIGGCSAFGP